MSYRSHQALPQTMAGEVATISTEGNGHTTVSVSTQNESACSGGVCRSQALQVLASRSPSMPHSGGSAGVYYQDGVNEQRFVKEGSSSNYNSIQSDRPDSNRHYHQAVFQTILPSSTCGTEVCRSNNSVESNGSNISNTAYREENFSRTDVQRFQFILQGEQEIHYRLGRHEYVERLLQDKFKKAKSFRKWFLLKRLQSKNKTEMENLRSQLRVNSLYNIIRNVSLDSINLTNGIDRKHE